MKHNLRHRFKVCAARWKDDNRYISNSKMAAEHPQYQEIIAMGKVALPWIFQDLLEKGASHWFIALWQITGENPITEKIAGKVYLMSAAWIVWGVKNGYLEIE